MWGVEEEQGWHGGCCLALYVTPEGWEELLCAASCPTPRVKLCYLPQEKPRRPQKSSPRVLDSATS